MCTNRRNQATVAQEIAPGLVPPSTNSASVGKAGTVQAAMRRKRNGVAADILTSPTGIPAFPQMGNR